MSSVMLSNLRECMNLRECLIQKPASVNASAVCLKLCYGGQGKNTEITVPTWMLTQSLSAFRFALPAR